MLDYQRAVKRLTEQIKKRYHPEKIILFGSYAQGKMGEYSDIDLLVVKKSNKNFVERIVDLYRILKPRMALDLLVYTPEEFDRLSRYNAFIRKIIREGVVLYEKRSSPRSPKMVRTGGNRPGDRRV